MKSYQSFFIIFAIAYTVIYFIMGIVTTKWVITFILAFIVAVFSTFNKHDKQTR